MSSIRPVILSGGSGTRLWPLSRELHPKQFISFDEDTLFGKTLVRGMGLPNAQSPLIVCNEKYRFFASAILREKGVSGSILLEPAPRNTAPAIALAALCALKDTEGTGEEEPLLLVLPSDHRIDPQTAFAAAVMAAADEAEKGLLLTFGVPPERPETGYGYIARGEILASGDGKSIYRVRRFAEKPDAATAAAFVASGEYFWNSGIFLFKASVYLEELTRCAPAMAEACRAAWESRSSDGDFLRFAEERFTRIPQGSIDYVVMEHTERAAVATLGAHWNDLGSWSSLYEESPKDTHGNAVIGDVLTCNAENSYLHAQHRLLAAMDIKDLAVIETADAVLVMDRHKTQGVREILARLKQENRRESALHPKVFRPWGSYEVLAGHDNFQVKRIIVNPGGVLSLQYHHHRAEHWVVVRGTAAILNGDREFMLHEDQSTYIPHGVRHRLENPGKLPLELIEVQTGSYLGEDDIVRLEDSYGRKDCR